MAGMVSYEVTGTGPTGFQVSVAHPVHGIHLIGNFCSLHEAETFAETMRDVDAGPSYGHAEHKSDTLIRRNRQLITAAAEARSAVRQTAMADLHANHNALWQRSLDLLPRVRATMSMNVAVRTKR